MRSLEIRVCATVTLATAGVIAAACWLFPTQGIDAHLQWWRGAGLAAAASTCVALGFYAIRRDGTRHGRHMLAQVQSCVLSEGNEVLPEPTDAAARQVVGELRTHIAQLRAGQEQLRVQRKTLEIQLRLADAEQRQTQTLINGISDAVMVTNNFDELIMANPAAAELFNFDPAASIRKPVADLLVKTRLSHDIADIRQAHSRSNRRTLEFTLDQDGTPRTFTVTMSCVIDNADQLSGVVTMLHETTREREISKMKNDFVSHVSHELRTPLSSIKAYAELLVDGEASEEKTRQEFYHVIQSEANRLSRLIDNILNISRIESGMVKITMKPVNVGAILKEVLEVAMPSARDKQITLTDHVPQGFFQVQADRDMIYQAALNLVSNAIKYTPAGGTVKVSTQTDESEKRITVLVRDTGVGIPPEAMRHLFEKFYRVEQHKNMAKGSGLGLNLTQQIIETVHKGKMIVESRVGEGSTFGFSLPILI